MIYPTTESEKQEFYAIVLPGFLEYLRSHMSAIEQVELATVKNGIVSFPATQIIGGVQKTVRVPLSLVTADIDAAETEAREMAAYAKQQGDYARQQAAAVNEAGDYANEQGRYAKAKGDEALAAKNTVTTWFNPFRDEAEDWAASAADAEAKRVQAENSRKATWTDWESAEAERQRKELLRIAAENDRIEAELQRAGAELQRARAELLRKDAEDRRLLAEDSRDAEERKRIAAELLRQQTFEDNEVKRQQDFEDAESERMQTMLVTHCFVDLTNMHLKFVTPKTDTTEYAIVDGHLNISFDYETT